MALSSVSLTALPIPSATTFVRGRLFRRLASTCTYTLNSAKTQNKQHGSIRLLPLLREDFNSKVTYLVNNSHIV